jgi:hypothetical protein
MIMLAMSVNRLAATTAPDALYIYCLLGSHSQYEIKMINSTREGMAVTGARRHTSNQIPPTKCTATLLTTPLREGIKAHPTKLPVIERL